MIATLTIFLGWVWCRIVGHRAFYFHKLDGSTAVICIRCGKRLK